MMYSFEKLGNICHTWLFCLVDQDKFSWGQEKELVNQSHTAFSRVHEVRSIHSFTYHVLLALKYLVDSICWKFRQAMIGTHHPSHDTAVSICITSQPQRLFHRLIIVLTEQQKVEAQNERISVVPHMHMTVKIISKFHCLGCLTCIHQILHRLCALVPRRRLHGNFKGFLISVHFLRLVQQIADRHDISLH